jgi:acyl carrier protein
MFDSDKIYQLISEVVEKLFVVEIPDEEPEQMPTFVSSLSTEREEEQGDGEAK